MEGNDRVRQACNNLLINVECDKFIDNPYCMPYMSYVSLWEYALPIKTIIIGQNPYPQAIYPEYGAALSYDEAKCRSPPKSVRVIADDLYDYNGTPKDATIRCFRDLWMLYERGVIAINETVFSKISPDVTNPNRRPIREAECQVRALQVLIGESCLMGQRVINCIAMGTSAMQMTSLLRGWCPNDLITMKVQTCMNPAALAPALSDSGSHNVTLKKTGVSKILSSIVEDYINMPPRNDNKRQEQNLNTFLKNSDNVASSASALNTEYANFLERLRGANDNPAAKATIDGLMDSISRIMRANDAHANSVSAHSMSFGMVVRSIPQQQQKQSAASQIGTISASAPSSTAMSPPSITPRRARPARRSSQATSETNTPSMSGSIDPIKEEEAVTPSPSPAPDVSVTPATPSETTPVRSRRIVRRVSRAPSVAGTEYTETTESGIAAPKIGSTIQIGPLEGMHIRQIGEIICKYADGDSTYQEMLDTMVDSGMVTSEICKNALEYVRSRMALDNSYSAFDEKDNEESDTVKWCLSQIKPAM